MEEYGRYRQDEIPPEKVEAAKAAATREVSDFSVSLISQQKVLGSGTLVSAGNAMGILTAYHVAEVVFRRQEPLGLNISDHVHQCFVDPAHMEHRSVGIPASWKRPEDGPDLSVIKLLDVGLLSTIRSRKSCYRLDGRSFSEYSGYPLNQMPWWIMGSPVEFERHQGELGTGKHVLTAIHFAAEASFIRFAHREPFDFIELRATAGAHGFPLRYGGVSGGGIWFAPLTMDPDVGVTSLGYASPILAGVVYYEGDLESGERRMLGHGPESVYGQAREALNAS